jgi:signal transduction histidine kinase
MHETATSIIQAIIIITSIFTLVASFVIAYFLYFNKRKARLIEENAYMRKEFDELLIRSRIEVQEQTFQQISKELHDNVGQLLSSSRMLLGITERTLKSPPAVLITANKTLGQAIHEIRTLAKALDKDWLKKFDLMANLQAEVERLNQGDIHAFLKRKGKIVLLPDEQIILFRIVQESIQNAIRHGEPDHITIVVNGEPGRMLIRIMDDGKGFGVANTEGLGIGNMRQRTAILGGTIDWQSTEGIGTTVSIRIPRRQ